MVEKTNSIFRSKDDIISMFFGLLVVGLVAYFLINFIEKRKGNINIPGVSNELELEIKDKDKISPEKNVEVARNDNLWKIAVREYGDGYKWTKIWQDNRSKLNSPDKLEIGMMLIIYDKI